MDEDDDEESKREERCGLLMCARHIHATFWFQAELEVFIPSLLHKYGPITAIQIFRICDYSYKDLWLTPQAVL